MDHLCPECVAGKHGNRYCSGWAIDDNDNIIPCQCACMDVPENGAPK